MNLVSLTIARNESWVIGASLRAALEWCDSAVVLLHACTDSTADIVEQIAAENPGRVNILEADASIWTEMQHRQWTLEEARKMGATHMAVVDCDEILCGDTLPAIRSRIELLKPAQFLGIPMRNLHRSLDRYRSDNGIWGSQAGTMIAFADAPNLCWRTDNGYDHHRRSPYGSYHADQMNIGGGLMHLQFASWRRLIVKHRWYKLMEVLKYPDRSVREIDFKYSMAPNQSGCMTSAVPAEWWDTWEDLRPLIDVDAEPWHVAECERLIEQHGIERFAGLDLFGMEAGKGVAD